MNFTKLGDFSELNLSVINGLSNTDNQIIETVIETADNTSQGYLGLGIMSVFFLAFTIMNFKETGEIRFDITRAMFFSSGISAILGSIMLISGITSNGTHVVWFWVIFATLYFLVREIKKRGK
jgi:uncharacterized membrane protein